MEAERKYDESGSREREGRHGWRREGGREVKEKLGVGGVVCCVVCVVKAVQFQPARGNTATHMHW